MLTPFPFSNTLIHFHNCCVSLWFVMHSKNIIRLNKNLFFFSFFLLNFSCIVVHMLPMILLSMDLFYAVWWEWGAFGLCGRGRDVPRCQIRGCFGLWYMKLNGNWRFLFNQRDSGWWIVSYHGWSERFFLLFFNQWFSCKFSGGKSHR